MTIRRGLAIGCGGTLGFAWTAVMLAELERALDWDPRQAEVLVGSSAGSEIVAALGSGRSAAELVYALKGEVRDPVLANHLAVHPGNVPPLPRPSWPALGLVPAGIKRRSPYSAMAGLLPKGRGDASWLREFGDALADDSGWVAHPNTWIVAADVKTGERAAFGRADAPRASLGDAIAASWGIPGWFPPVEIGGRRYVDGGAVSTASVDLLRDQELDEVIVVAPMATKGGIAGRGLDRFERVLRREMTRVLDREVRALEESGIRVIRIEPGPEELSAMGPNFMDLRRREATVEAATNIAKQRVEEALS